MKRSRTWLLLMLVLGVGAYILLVERHRESRAAREDELRRAFRVDVERAERLRIRMPELAVEVRLVDGEWVLSDPRGARANEALVRQTLSRLRELSRGELITPADMRERGQTLEDFGLAVSAAVLELEDHRGAREYRIGNPNPLGDALYVKEESGQNIMVITSDLLEILPKDADTLRDRRLLSFPAATVTTLTLQSPEGLQRIERRNGEWMFTEPGRFPADAEAVERLIEKLSLARIEDFVHEEVDAEGVGLDPSRYEIRAHSSVTPMPMELRLGAGVSGEPDRRYARFAGREGIFKVSEGLKMLAETELMALRDSRVLPVSVGDVRGYTVKGEERVSLRREEGRWRMTEPVEQAAEAGRARRFAEVWTEASIVEILKVEEPPERIYTVRFSAENVGRGVPLAFEVLESGESGRAWVRPEGFDEIWQVVPDTLSRLPAEPVEYLSREVLRFDAGQVIRVSVESEGRRRVYTREGEGEDWKVEAEDSEVEAEAVSRVVEVASRLQAARLLEMKTVSPADYGLEDAPLRISFGLGGADPANRTLLLRSQPDGEGLTGMVQGGGAVFTLDEPTSEALRSLQSPPLTSPEAENEASSESSH